MLLQGPRRSGSGFLLCGGGQPELAAELQSESLRQECRQSSALQLMYFVCCSVVTRPLPGGVSPRLAAGQLARARQVVARAGPGRPAVTLRLPLLAGCCSLTFPPRLARAVQCRENNKLASSFLSMLSVRPYAAGCSRRAVVVSCGVAAGSCTATPLHRSLTRSPPAGTAARPAWLQHC